MKIVLLNKLLLRKSFKGINSDIAKEFSPQNKQKPQARPVIYSSYHPISVLHLATHRNQPIPAWKAVLQFCGPYLVPVQTLLSLEYLSIKKSKNVILCLTYLPLRIPDAGINKSHTLWA